MINMNTVNTVDDSIIDLFKQQMQENKEMKHFLLEQQKQILEQNKQIIELSKEKKTTIYNTNCNNTINRVILFNDDILILRSLLMYFHYYYYNYFFYSISYYL